LITGRDITTALEPEWRGLAIFNLGGVIILTGGTVMLAYCAVMAVRYWYIDSWSTSSGKIEGYDRPHSMSNNTQPGSGSHNARGGSTTSRARVELLHDSSKIWIVAAIVR
jgi:hypothetical protein